MLSFSSLSAGYVKCFQSVAGPLDQHYVPSWFLEPAKDLLQLDTAHKLLWPATITKLDILQ